MQTTLPKDEDPPAFLSQIFNILVISDDILCKFLLPEIRPGGWGTGVMTIGMSVPETAMDKNDQIIFGQDNIRFSGQILSMQSKAKSTSVQKASHSDFRLCITALDPSHHVGSGLWIYDISHLSFSCTREMKSERERSHERWASV